MGIRDLRPLADEYQMIIVCPAGENSWYWDSPTRKNSQFETFISKELPAFIDKRYKTVADRTGRAITGLSMGGHGAMWNALRNVRTFGAVGSMSGGLDIRPFPEKWKMSAQLGAYDQNKEVWDKHAAINAIGKLKNNQLAIIIDCGVNDFFLDVNREFHKALVEKGITHEYIERAGKHDSAYWRNSIIYQLFFFNEYFAQGAEARRLRQEAKEGDIATIDNGYLKLKINKKGAELFSIEEKLTGREYLWQGDPTHWKFRSPVLFPIVGAVYNNSYRLGGKEYNMTIHGIARDYDFKITRHNQTEIVYQLKSNEEMKKKYPCDFTLEIGYKLSGSNIRVSYRVINPSDETIYFQLGAHPGFNFKNFDPEAAVQGYYAFNDKEANDKLNISISSKDGFIVKKKGVVTLTDKKMPITKDTFNNGALILEGEQTKDISLLDSDGNAYVRVRYDAPVVGLWSNANKGYAPFACIEPWYGRCDKAGYKGKFEAKDWVQSLEAGKNFNTSISIGIMR